jgi:hypothetical protein
MDVARDLDVDVAPARRLQTEALRHGAPVPDGMAPTPRATRVGYAVDQRLGGEGPR